MVPSCFMPGMEEASLTYEEIWKFRDEEENFQQKYDAELIKELKRCVLKNVQCMYTMYNVCNIL